MITKKKKSTSATLREVQAMLKGTCQSIMRTDAATLQSDPEHGPYTLVTNKRGALAQTGTLDQLRKRVGRYLQGGPATYFEAMTVAQLLEELQSLPLTAHVHLLSTTAKMLAVPFGGSHSRQGNLPLVSLETDNLEDATKVKNIYLLPGKAK